MPEVGLEVVLTGCFCQAEKEAQKKKANKIVGCSCKSTDDCPQCHHDTLGRLIR
jgi:hypothetical protein